MNARRPGAPDVSVVSEYPHQALIEKQRTGRASRAAEGYVTENDRAGGMALGGWNAAAAMGSVQAIQVSCVGAILPQHFQIRGESLNFKAHTQRRRAMGLLEEAAGAFAAVEGLKKVDPNAGIVAEGVAAVAGFEGTEAITNFIEKKEEEKKEEGQS